MSNSPGPGRYRRRIGRRATRIESNYLGARTPREAGRLGIAGGDRVGKGGVEPPHRFRYTDLNRARLPFRHLPGASPKERRLAAATVARRPGLEMGVPQGRPIESPDASRDARSSAPAPMTVEGVAVSLAQRFERRLEGLVGGAFARVFKGQVEPVEIGTALQREAA